MLTNFGLEEPAKGEKSVVGFLLRMARMTDYPPEPEDIEDLDSLIYYTGSTNKNASPGYSSLVKDYERFKEFRSKHESIWPACRNLFMYRISILNKDYTIVNAPAILVNYEDTSGFFIWHDKKSSMFPAHRGGQVYFLNSSYVSNKDRVVVIPSNRYTNLGPPVPPIIPLLVRLVRHEGGIGTIHRGLTEIKSALQQINAGIPIRNHYKEDTPTLRAYNPGDAAPWVTGVTDAAPAIQRVTKIAKIKDNQAVGFPAVAMNSREQGWNKQKQLFHFNGIRLSSLFAAEKKGPYVNLHVFTPRDIDRAILRWAGLDIERNTTYTIGKKLAKEVIPELNTTVSRVVYLLVNPGLYSRNGGPNRALLQLCSKKTIAKLLRNSTKSKTRSSIVKAMRHRRAVVEIEPNVETICY